jgi:hypothetical protein
VLTKPSVFRIDGRLMAGWSAGDKRVLSHAGHRLSQELKGNLSSRCTHIKNHGGVKKSLRLLTRDLSHFRFAARYHESINHNNVVPYPDLNLKTLNTVQRFTMEHDY